MPLLFFPIILASTTDAIVALGRIGKFLAAEELAEPFLIDNDSKNAIEVDGTFTWETAGKPANDGTKPSPKKTGHGGDKKGKDKTSKLDPKSVAPKTSRWKRKSATTPELPVSTTDEEKDKRRLSDVPSEEIPFELKDLKFKIPKGTFVAIVSVQPLSSCLSVLIIPLEVVLAVANRLLCKL